MSCSEITPEAFAELEGLDDWRFVFGAIHATFLARSYTAAAELVSAITAAAEEMQHHPDIDVRYPGRVRVRLTTHATRSLTTLDVDLARRISALAAEADCVSEPVSAQAFEVAIDTDDADRIRPFWKALLGYVEVDGVLFDPLRIGPSMWFQHTDQPRDERSRFHIDVNVAHDVAQQRIEAAIAAGGRLVTDQFARAWWVLADADGNEACVCTWQDRS